MNENEPQDEAQAAPTRESGSDLARVVAERDEYLASWQRAQADYQNLRRRIGSDTEAAVARAKQALLAELLLVLDYLELALAAPCASSEGKNLHAGVELTRQQLWRVLEREGVKLVPESGRFDAAVHQAVEHVESSEQPEGTILTTLRRGYTLGNQILRAGQVRVSSGAQRAQAEAG